MKSAEDRGAFATWLRTQRKAPRPNLPNGWKEAEAVRRLEAAVPGVSFGTYRDIEAGNRKPTPDQRRAIEAVFGTIPDFTAEVPVSDTAGTAALIRALEAQTAAISRLVEALDRAALPDVVGEMRGAVAALEADTRRSPQSPDPEPAEASPQGGPGRMSSIAPALSGTPRP